MRKEPPRPAAGRRGERGSSLADLVKNSKTARADLANYYRFALTEEGRTIKL